MTKELIERYQQAQALEQGAFTRHMVLNDAVLPHWIEDSDCCWYIRETRDGKVFRLVDAKAASNQSAFNHQALADALTVVVKKTVSADDLPIVVERIQLSPRQVHLQAFGQSWLFDETTTTCQPIDNATKDAVTDHELLSPDGKKVAFVRDHNLWVRETETSREWALTEDGSADNAYATAPAVFGFSFAPKVQAVWSPDSQTLLTHRLNLRGVARRPVIEQVPEDGGLRPRLSEYPAAYAGDKIIERYRFMAINAETSQQQVADYDPVPFYRFGSGFFSHDQLGWWSQDNRHAYFVAMARGARTVRVVVFDTQTGTTDVLFEETAGSMIKLAHCAGVGEQNLLRVLPETDELIWFSERSGWGHLYLYDLNTGALKRPLTQGNWLVRNILHVDVARREMILQTAGRDTSMNPYYRDICRLQWDTGELTPLIEGPYEHMVFTANDKLVKWRLAFGLDGPGVSGVSLSGEYVVVTYSRVDTAPISVLIDRAGNRRLTLEQSEPFGVPEDWQWPEPFTVKAADGETDLYGVLYRPPGCCPQQSYPVVEYTSGHPDFTIQQSASFNSTGTFGGLTYFRAASYAALGCVVITLEGRGTPYRHRAFQHYSDGDMAKANAFEDHIAGLQQLVQRYPFMDITRVGLVAPDSATAPVYGLLEYPDVYTVGVSVAFQDSRFAPAGFVETFEGDATKKTAHNKKTLEVLANQLEGKLLVVHGLLDTMDDPAGTFRLIHALQKANKDVDLLLLPNLGADVPNYVLRRSWDYLVEHLLGETPPKEFVLTKGVDLLIQNMETENEHE